MIPRAHINVKANVFITARERGKIVTTREGHNMWVNLGRVYAARVVTPQADWTHLDDRVVKFMGAGIGGEYGEDVTGQLDYDYPGQHTYTDTSTLIPVTLERPVKITGTDGRTSADNTWMNTITINEYTPSFSGDPEATVEFRCTFVESDIGLGGVFASVPLTEIGLFLSDQISTLTAVQVYDYDASPAYIETTRQQQIAYFPFETISKTPSITVEALWQLVF